MLGKPQLGNQSLAIIYSVFALANFIAPPIVQALGTRISMIIVGGGLGAIEVLLQCLYSWMTPILSPHHQSSAGYALFIATFLKPEVWSILTCSAVLGVCAAILWTAQGAFLTANSTDTNRGVLSGVFWSEFYSE